MKEGTATTVFIVFLILKLCHVITWSWWWVTSPLWIVAGLWLAILVISMLFAGWDAIFGDGH